MQLRPILSAMRRNKVGAILIAVQMAITLAILCNSLFIIQERLASSKRATAVAVYGATQCSRILLPAVVRVPVRHMLSLTASGTPASGKR